MEILREGRNVLDYPALESLFDDIGPELMPRTAARFAKQEEEATRAREQQEHAEGRQRQFDEGVGQLQSLLNSGDLSRDEYLKGMDELRAVLEGSKKGQDTEASDVDRDDRMNEDDSDDAIGRKEPAGRPAKRKGVATRSRGRPVVELPIRKSKSSGALGRGSGGLLGPGSDSEEVERSTKKARSDIGDPKPAHQGPFVGVRGSLFVPFVVADQTSVQSMPELLDADAMRSRRNQVRRTKMCEVLPRSQGLHLGRGGGQGG